MRPSSLYGLKVPDIPLDKAFTIGKRDKLAQLIHLVIRKGVDRAIITSEGKPVGVVTVKDVLMKLSTKHLKGLSPSSMTISGFMSEKFVSSGPYEDLLVVSRKMRDENISALPIVSDHQPIGLVTRKRIVGLLRDKSRMKVRHFTTSSAITINPDAKILQALEKIRKSPIKEIIVMNDKIPVGILSEKEIALTFFDLLSRDSVYHADSVLKKLLVMDVMRRIDKFVEPESQIDGAIDLLLDTDLNTLPVASGGKFLGALTRDAIFLKFLELEESRGWKQV
ncbi:MAG: CBS domain-containing protein [Nitrososphaerales archaeon]|nr:CBS domain-containing protein [Nitrososphaerales archaeon]